MGESPATPDAEPLRPCSPVPLTVDQYIHGLGESAAIRLEEYLRKLENTGTLVKASWIAAGLEEYQKTGDVAALLHVGAAAGPAAFGHIYQKAETAVWDNSGHTTSEYGNSKTDGKLEATVIECKVASYNTNKGWLFNKLAHWHGGTVNVALAMHPTRPIAEWYMLTGTTPQLQKSLKELAGLNPERRSGKLGKQGDGRRYLSVSDKELGLYAGWVDRVISVDEWVRRRNQCGF